MSYKVLGLFLSFLMFQGVNIQGVAIKVADPLETSSFNTDSQKDLCDKINYIISQMNDYSDQIIWFQRFDFVEKIYDELSDYKEALRDLSKQVGRILPKKDTKISLGRLEKIFNDLEKMWEKQEVLLQKKLIFMKILLITLLEKENKLI